MASYEWPPSGGGGGVSSLNGLTGAVTLAAGTGISITPSGNTLTIANTSVTPPGGTSGQVQYNNDGAFGGFGNWDGTTLAITGNITATSFIGPLTGHASLDLALTGGTMSGAINMGSNLINAVTNPVSAQDAATKSYVDAAISALNPAAACICATVGSNLIGTYVSVGAGLMDTFTITTPAIFVLDGVTPALGARVLIKDQSSGYQNGIYTITTLGTALVSTVFTRAADYDTPADMNSAGLIPITQGTVNALSSWQQTAVIVSIGPAGTALVFQEFTANPSLYLLKANNLSDVASKTTSFNNISPLTTIGDILYGAASGAGTRLAGNTTTAVQLLSSVGSGSAATAPAWLGSTGSGNVVLATSPTLVTPVIGAATGTSLSVSGQLTSTIATGTAPLVVSSTTQVANLNSATAGSATTATNLAGGLGGQIPYQSAAGTTAFVANGTVGQALLSGGTTAAYTWGNVLTNPMTTGGDIIYGGSSGTPTRLANGNLGQVLTSAGSTSAPTWAFANYSQVVSKTTTYTALATDGLILCSGSAFTLTLPSASAGTQVLTIRKTDSSLANIITIARAGSDTISGTTSGLTSTTLNTQGETVVLVSDGTSVWHIENRYGNVTPWVSYTPTLGGMTSTSPIYSRRNGDSLEMYGTIVLTAVAASSAEINLGFNGTTSNVTVASTAPSSTFLCGLIVRNESNTDEYFAQSVASQGFITIGIKSAGNPPFTAQNGSTLFGSTDTFAVMGVKVPITGWN